MRRFMLLTEIHRIQTLLLESRIDVLRSKYLERIVAIMPSLDIPQDDIADYQTAYGEFDPNLLFNKMVDLDPDPQKKNTQWLLNLLISGKLPYEDFEKAPDYLSKWMEKKKKKELPPEAMDLGRFKSLGDLFAAISNSDNTIQIKKDAEWQAAMAVSDLLYDDGAFMVVVPNTKEAAMYWGRDTEWCTSWGDPKGRHPTRSCRYSSYAYQGPMYVIIDKQTGNRWQFHFETQQFMDVNDNQINLGQFIREHPFLMQVIGETKLVKYIDKIGLSLFSKEAISQVPSNKLYDAVLTYADFMLLPENKQHDASLVKLIINRNPEILETLPQEYYVDDIGALLAYTPNAFTYLPSNLQTVENADYAASKISWRGIEQHIPLELWSERTTDKYWTGRALDDVILHLKDIPRKYHSDETVIRKLAQHVEDIPDFVDYLTTPIVYKVADKNVNSVAYLPKRFLTADLAKRLIDMRLKVVQQTITPRTLSQLPLIGDALSHFPKSEWTDMLAKFMLSDKRCSFGDVPERLRNDEFVEWVIKNRLEDIKTVDKKYLTPPVIKNVITPYNITSFPTNLLNDDIIIDLIDKNRHSVDAVYANLPSQLKTAKVMRVFVDNAVVPIDQIPPDLLTLRSMMDRIEKKPDEFDKIPTKYLSERYVALLAAKNYAIVPKLPKKFLTEQTMYYMLLGLKNVYSRHGYGNRQQRALLDLFPKSIWSSRVVELALRHDFIYAKMSEIPTDTMSKEVAAALVSRNSSELSNIPKQYINADFLIEVSKKCEASFIDQLSPEMVTEPVAYAFVSRFVTDPVLYEDGSSSSYYTNDTLKKLPRDNWSLRVYELAIGRCVSLKEVPAKYRKPNIVFLAIARKPQESIPLMKDAAGWLNAHEKLITESAYNTKLKQKSWLAGAESVGLIRVKKQGFINARDLEKAEFENGFVTKIKSGPINSRYFVFDKNGKFVARMYTDRNIVYIPEWERAIKHRKLFCDAANANFKYFIANDLNHLGIHDTKTPQGYVLEENYSRIALGDGKLSYSIVDHLSGNKIKLFDHSNKLVMTIETGEIKGRWGKSNEIAVLSMKCINTSVMLRNASTMKLFLQRERLPFKDKDERLFQIGIVTKTRGYSKDYLVLVAKRLGTIGEYTIWYDESSTILSVSDKEQGVIAYAPATAKTFDLVNKYGKMSKAEAKELFAQVNQELRNNRGTFRLKQ